MVESTSDGNFVVTGGTKVMAGQTYYKTFLMKLDASGSLLWNAYFNQDTESNFPTAMLEAANGDLLVYGQDRSVLPSARNRAFFARLTAGGSIIWAKTHDVGIGAGNSEITACVEDPLSGHFYFTGFTANGYLLFGSLDAAGNLLHAQAVKNSGNAKGNGIVPTPDGNYLIVGLVTVPSQGGKDLLFLELKLDGSIVKAIAQGNAASQ